MSADSHALLLQMLQNGSYKCKDSSGNLLLSNLTYILI